MEIKKIEEKKQWVSGFDANRESVKRTFFTRLVVHNEHGGFVEDEYKFEIGEDGWITIWNERNDFMNIAPEAADQLRQFLHEFLS